MEILKNAARKDIVLNILFNNYPDAILFKDKNFRITFVNRQFCDYFGINRPEDITGKFDMEFLPADNNNLLKLVDKKIMKESKPLDFLMQVKKGNSESLLSITAYPVIRNEKFIGIIYMAEDITYEENLKERLVMKHSQLKALLENVPMLIYMQDVNKNYITGTKTSWDFVKNGVDILNNLKIDFSELGKISEDDDFVIKNHTSKTDVKEIYDTNGIPHWYKILKAPIDSLNGNITGLVTIANNIDAEKRLENQRETFVASLGHDLKNPTLAQIRAVELLLKEHFGSINDEQKNILEMVLESCRYMNGMLSSLLATYRGGAVQLVYDTFSLKNLVEECVEEMIYIAKDKGVGVFLDNKMNDDSVIGDKVQIKRVIMNLLSNGIKYAFKKSDLRIAIFIENNSACFEFENESPYISPEKQESIFAQYVSFADTHKEMGIGLGLYASKKIIEAHEGKIFVKSSADDRNTFGFKIPLFIKNPERERTVIF